MIAVVPVNAYWTFVLCAHHPVTRASRSTFDVAEMNAVVPGRQKPCASERYLLRREIRGIRNGISYYLLICHDDCCAGFDLVCELFGELRIEPNS